MYEYLEPTWLHKHSKQKHAAQAVAKAPEIDENEDASTTIDRTVKQLIGGKQARPDSGYSFPVYASDGKLVGEAPLGNRKDIRNAAHKAESGQVLPAAYASADPLLHLEKTSSSVGRRLPHGSLKMVGEDHAAAEVESASNASSLTRRGPTSTQLPCITRPCAMSQWPMNEVIGVVGIICPTENPCWASYLACSAGNCRWVYGCRGSLREASDHHR